MAGLVGGYLLVRENFSGTPATLQDTLSSAPSFELPLVTSDLSMQGVRLSDFKGKPLLVNFWASWCNICRTEASLLEGLFQKADGKLQVVAVASYDNPLNVRQTERFQQASYPIAIDPEGRLAQDYRVPGLPKSFLIDGEGRIRKQLSGPLTADRVTAILQDVEQLAQTEASAPKI